MLKGDRYVGIINGQRHWKALVCSHPVSHYQTKRCQKCWFSSSERHDAVTKKRNYKIIGKNHHSWKGGRIINSGGYIEVRVDKKYLIEHRLIMEKHLARKLKGSEEVHHINHNKVDNRIENLMLFDNHAAHIAYEHNNGDRKK